MKTKKKLLRLGALLMTVLLSMASPVSASATETGNAPGGNTAGAESPVIDRDATGSLTIYKYDKKIREDAEAMGAVGSTDDRLKEYAVKGVKFTYVKISDLTEAQSQTVKTVSGNEISTSVVTAFEPDAALKGILWPAGTQQPEGISLDGDRVGYTTTQLNKAVEELYRGDGDGMTGAPTEVKNALEAYIKTKTGQVVTTDENGKAHVNGLELGLYLVVETEVPNEVTSTVNPFFVSIPMTNEAGNGWNYDVTVYPKNQLEDDTDKPTLEKYVKKAADAGSTVSPGDPAQEEGCQETLTASFGDELEYRIVCRLPVITSEATYLTELAVKDEVTGGIRYKEGSFQIDFYEEEADAKAGTGTPLKEWKETDGQAYFAVSNTAPADLSDGYTAGRTIAISDDGLDVINQGIEDENNGANYSGKYMAITYRATVVPDGAALGDAGLRNHAGFHWKRTGEEGGEDPTPPGAEDEAIVFTYGLQLDKLFYRGDNQVSGNDAIAEKLQNGGVKFRLRKEGTGYIQAAEGTTGAPGNTAGGISGEQPGNTAPSKIYDVTGFTANEADAAVLSPGSDGKLMLRGLSAGTYTLKETETLSGFALLVNDVEITITEATAEQTTGPDGTKTWNITEPAAAVSGLGSGAAEVDMTPYEMKDGTKSMNALVKLEVVNKALPFLANTGGIGILPFLLGGGALILISVLLLWRRKKRSAASVMAVVVLAGALGTAASFDAEAVDLGQKCTLTIETRTNAAPDTDNDRYSDIPDAERPELKVDLYKIADAKAVPAGSDAAGTEGPRYDMYTLKLTDEFTALQASQDAADKVTQKDLEDIMYADSDAQIRAAYLELANKATKTVLGIKVENGEVKANPQKSKMDPLATQTVNGANGTKVFGELDSGLYLVIPHGAALTDPTDYMVALTGEEDPELEVGDGSLAAVAYGRQYLYRYAPELVALPQREEPAAGGNTGSADAWKNEVTATLKAEVGSRYASLKIVKNRAFGTEEGDPKDPGLTGEDNFVYQIEATLGGKSVYSNVAMLTMPADKDEAERTLELIVPVGAKITVTEVYDGAGHELPEGAGEETIDSAAADERNDNNEIVKCNTVTFTNKYNGTGTGGGAVENRFTYGDKGDGNKGWQWTPVPENARKTDTGQSGGQDQPDDTQ